VLHIKTAPGSLPAISLGLGCFLEHLLVEFLHLAEFLHFELVLSVEVILFRVEHLFLQF
jgi:hypothetical protein